MIFLVEAVCGCVKVGPGAEGVVRTGYLVACVKQFTYFLDHSVGWFGKLRCRWFVAVGAFCVCIGEASFQSLVKFLFLRPKCGRQL